MHIDFKRWGLFFILLATIYLISNLLFSTYYFINVKIFPLNIILDKKVILLFLLGIGLNWNELKYLNFNVIELIKRAIYETYQSIPFLILLSIVFMLPEFNNLSKSQIIYEAFQLITSLAIWKSCHK
jgi:hypothetical protein